MGEADVPDAEEIAPGVHHARARIEPVVPEYATHPHPGLFCVTGAEKAMPGQRFDIHDHPRCTATARRERLIVPFETLPGGPFGGANVTPTFALHSFRHRGRPPQSRGGAMCWFEPGSETATSYAAGPAR